MNRLVVLFSVLLLMAMVPLAQGALQLSYDVNGGGATTCLATAANTGTCADIIGAEGIGGLNITGFGGASNSPGGPLGAFEFSGVGAVVNTSGATHTIEFWVASTDFVTPNTPPSIVFTSNLSGTAAVGGPNSFSLESCVDTANGTAPPSDTFCSPTSPTGSYLLANPTLIVSGPAGNNSNTVSAGIADLGPALFSLGMHYTLIIPSGAGVNFTGSNVLTQVPEPMSVSLLAGVLIATGLGLRKRFVKQ
jgi:hypothetical protein